MTVTIKNGSLILPIWRQTSSFRLKQIESVTLSRWLLTSRRVCEENHQWVNHGCSRATPTCDWLLLKDAGIQQQTPTMWQPPSLLTSSVLLSSASFTAGGSVMNGGEDEDVSGLSFITAGNTVLDRRVVLWPQLNRQWTPGKMRSDWNKWGGSLLSRSHSAGVSVEMLVFWYH